MASDKTRFVIIGSGRSGSTMLKNLLRSHPNIISFGELLNINRIQWDYYDMNDVYNTPDLHELRSKNPRAFVDMVFNIVDSEDIQCVGFKSLYNHYSQDKSFREILKYIIEDHSIRIIHNKRANIFKTFCSYEVARARTKLGKTMNAYRKEDVENEVVVEVDPAACLDFIRATKKEQAKFEAMFSGRKMIDVVYEDLAQRTGYEMKKVLAFLDAPYKPLKLDTFKVRQKPISQVVGNYEAVREFLSGKGFGEFFKD